MPDVTNLLNALEAGQAHRANELLLLVYDELRKLAAAKLAQEKPGQTLDATALVHEAYLRLVGDSVPGDSPGVIYANRGHFFAAAAEAMRRILIENARRKKTDKAGGGRQRHDLIDAELAVDTTSDDLFAVDEALSRFAKEHPRPA